MAEIVKGGRKELMPLDEGDDEIIQVSLYMPRWLHRALKRTSAIKDRTASSIVREALEKELRSLESEPYPPVMPPLKFGKKEALEKIEGLEIDDSALKQVLDHCTSFFGGFEIDGEGGFIHVFDSQGWKLKDLTSEQWEAVLNKLQIGFNGYDELPSEEGWLAKFEGLEPSEEQLKDLSYEE
jgi:hypothetical protein